MLSLSPRAIKKTKTKAGVPLDAICFPLAPTGAQDEPTGAPGGAVNRMTGNFYLGSAKKG